MVDRNFQDSSPDSSLQYLSFLCCNNSSWYILGAPAATFLPDGTDLGVTGVYIISQDPLLQNSINDLEGEGQGTVGYKQTPVLKL